MTGDLLSILVVYLAGCTIAAWIARSQGRSPLVWFGISALLSPVLGFVAVILSAPPRAR